MMTDEEIVERLATEVMGWVPVEPNKLLWKEENNPTLWYVGDPKNKPRTPHKRWQPLEDMNDATMVMSVLSISLASPKPEAGDFLWYAYRLSDDFEAVKGSNPARAVSLYAIKLLDYRETQEIRLLETRIMKDNLLLKYIRAILVLLAIDPDRLTWQIRRTAALEVLEISE